MKNNTLRPSYEVVSYDTDSGKVSMDIKTVKDILAVGTNVTDSEVIQFMQLCKYRRLNPFTKQAYLVKFKDKADIIVGIDVFTQRLTDNPACDGWECGVIVLNEKKEIVRRPGTFYLDNEQLVGAYCDIRKKGWKDPFPWTIRLKDFYRTYKKDGRVYPMGQWGTMPGIMLTKCAIVSAVRKVFGEEFGGMYSAEEMGVENNVIDANFTEIKEPDDEKIKELTKPLTSEQMLTLKEAAKSIKSNYDSEKMVSYVLEQLNIHNGTNSKKIEKLQNQYFELALLKIKETKQVAEKKAKKEESIKKEAENKAKDEKSKNTDEKNKNKKNEVETDLPIPEIDANTAKPANTKKDKKETKDVEDSKDKNKK